MVMGDYDGDDDVDFFSSGNPEFNSNGQYHWDYDDDAKQ
jgi:hypothetical protein